MRVVGVAGLCADQAVVVWSPGGSAGHLGLQILKMARFGRIRALWADFPGADREFT